MGSSLTYEYGIFTWDKKTSIRNLILHVLIEIKFTPNLPAHFVGISALKQVKKVTVIYNYPTFSQSLSERYF